MSTTSEYYQAQADLCAVQAAGASLPRLREKFLRSQFAWQALADRISLSDSGKKNR